MTRRPVLWVVDPSLNTPEDQGVAEVIRDWTGETRLFRPALRPGDGPSPADGYSAAGIVLLGSAASVLDDRPWLEPLADWLRPVIGGEKPIPLLGICFGHQLVAHLAGGTVGYVRDDRSKVVGVQETRVSGSRLLPGEPSLRVVVSHREEVKRAPDGYDVVARRPAAAVDGIEHRSLPLFSFQFHPEAREEFARRAGFDTDALDDRLRQDSQRLLGAFRQRVASQLKP